MLVLSRKPGETIQIGNEIVLTVLRVSGNRVHLGVQAPASVAIARGELTKTPVDPASLAVSARNDLGERAERHAAPLLAQ